jgi:S-adenosylmethionine-diacylgycerolhomoserine-N-methlytransferase
MTVNTASEHSAKTAMDNMYRLTRHVYDLSRKYYLLGRDRLIDQLQPKDGALVCEVGCGTARNLIKMTACYPDAYFYGLDASEEMLKTARSALKRKNLQGAVKIAHGFSQSFDPIVLFQLSRPLDQIVFSYALSIIPPWQESIDHALTLLPSGGQIHIVDFGAMQDLPPWFRKFVLYWLSLFHVYHKPEILEYLKALEQKNSGTLHIQSLYKGYAYLARFIKA